VIRQSEDTFRDFLFQQLGGLISIVRQHIRNYLNDIFDLIKEFWIVDSPLQPTIILLVPISLISVAPPKYSQQCNMY
jgi:FKBP12-rapamycin complex-associated protein